MLTECCPTRPAGTPLAAGEIRPTVRHTLQLLEMHAANVCNLTCESCSHFSNSGHKGWLHPNDAASVMNAWKARLKPVVFRFLGGEPTINPYLTELLHVARQHWPDSRIELTTNGFFLDRHPQLPRALHELNVSVNWSIHHASSEYAAKVREIEAVWDRWRKEFPFELRRSDSTGRWTRRYRGFGPDVLPYHDSDPRRSWCNCAGRTCRQLFQGKLWKCPPVAYLQLQKQTHPQLSPEWNPYLAYQPLEAGCGDEELAAFLRREDELVCGMCPSRPEHFEKSSPLIPVGILLKRRRQE